MDLMLVRICDADTVERLVIQLHWNTDLAPIRQTTGTHFSASGRVIKRLQHFIPVVMARDVVDEVQNCQ